MSVPWRAVRLVLGGGLVAGALDIAYACAFWAIKAAVPAQRILQSVAAGLLGTESFAGGSWDFGRCRLAWRTGSCSIWS